MLRNQKTGPTFHDNYAFLERLDFISSRGCSSTVRWVSANPRLFSIIPIFGSPTGNQLFFFKGHDLSSLKMLEDGGCIYKDTARHNKTMPADDILASGGMNSVRLRVWVNPVDGLYGLQYNLDLARRFEKKGFKIYLDFHFA
jgi:arabinogalactan endo-1,4-beta-galactosidase